MHFAQMSFWTLILGSQIIKGDSRKDRRRKHVSRMNDIWVYESS